MDEPTIAEPRKVIALCLVDVADGALKNSDRSLGSYSDSILGALRAAGFEVTLRHRQVEQRQVIRDALRRMNTSVADWVVDEHADSLARALLPPVPVQEEEQT